MWRFAKSAWGSQVTLIKTIFVFSMFQRGFWEDFGKDLGVLGGIVGPWRPLGEGLERCKRQQGATKASWGDFGTPWRGFGEDLIANWAHLGCLVAPWEALGCVMGASREVFLVFWMGFVRDALFLDVFFIFWSILYVSRVWLILKKPWKT